jgi:hypothetical protein
VSHDVLLNQGAGCGGRRRSQTLRKMLAGWEEEGKEEREEGASKCFGCAWAERSFSLAWKELFPLGEFRA